ncbi:TPA: NAD-dependent epimerase/dehydratase family protein [Providencia alcalifaciens]|uniref:UDP-glucose 4-epimerase n=1 Tax=Providencia alcalifaciens TaxID=126385 RepID=A0A346CL50_9GAMM|nr:NAD-dependent epimerase/dehydratase family protein [Providencia alcalifaciens]AXL96324.1 NAD-dependent epimerase/dehydratase [Providencia alcalifaciens]MTC38695.1 NAD-dependent epimerase/dehydratase family protein [Providencia alcalifaciens]HEF8786613.1 NAD-dependent epimerase/dehydratase family protein [Providencia alcalifaciens]
MKILVLGGTGAMGVHLVKLLAEKNYQVSVTSRNKTGNTNNINYIQGNAHNSDFLNSLLSQSWDAIVDFMIYSTPSFQQRYTQFLNATKQYIFISSSRVYADSEQPITENSLRLLDTIEDKAYLSTDEYALTKARQENLLFDSANSNWTIIRPYITYDDERLQLGVLEKEDWLYRALHGRSIVTAKDIQTKLTTLTTGKDVAKGICALIGNKLALREAFHITSSQSISWQQISETYLHVLAEYGFKVNLHEQNLDHFLSWRQGKYQVIYDRLFNRVFNNEKISQFIDTSTFTPPQTGLKVCLQNFLNCTPHRFKSINWQEEALKDSELNERTNLKEISCTKQKIKYYLFKNLPRVGRLLTR